VQQLKMIWQSTSQLQLPNDNNNNNNNNNNLNNFFNINNNNISNNNNNNGNNFEPIFDLEREIKQNQFFTVNGTMNTCNGGVVSGRFLNFTENNTTLNLRNNKSINKGLHF